MEVHFNVRNMGGPQNVIATIVGGQSVATSKDLAARCTFGIFPSVQDQPQVWLGIAIGPVQA